MIKIIKKYFKYPIDMERKITKHEENMLKKYSEIIVKNYAAFFESLSFEIEIELSWESGFYKRTCSRSRRKFDPTYCCYVICEIKKDGQVVKISSDDGEVDYYPLSAGWEISRLGFPFIKPYYFLFEDIEEVYEDMDELKKLVDKKFELYNK